MAGGKSDYFEDLIIEYVLGDSETLQKWDILYVAVTTEYISDSDTGETLDEPSGNGYGRVPITSSSDYWVKRTGGERRNLHPIEFPRATGDWSFVRGFALCTEATGGEILWHGNVFPARFVHTDDILRFDVEDLIIREE